MKKIIEMTAGQLALTRTVFAGIIVLAVMAAVFPWALSGTVPQLAAGAVLAILTVVAWHLRQSNVLRALVFLDAVWAIFTLGTLAQIAWLPPVLTVLVCVVPLLCLHACNRMQWLRPVTPWLRWGRVTPGLIGFGVATVVLAGAALIAWAVIARPEPAPYLLGLQQPATAVAEAASCPWTERVEYAFSTTIPLITTDPLCQTITTGAGASAGETLNVAGWALSLLAALLLTLFIAGFTNAVRKT